MIGQLERAYQVLEDATPERLVGHGGVSPDLKAALGPDIAELQLALRTMQALVHQLRRESG
ncbi:MAG: hypothetical protein HY332_13330 [Chloroflexi bacterium]|nr:hypothetical protein [Chloroflexota bacterium]